MSRSRRSSCALLLVALLAGCSGGGGADEPYAPAETRACLRDAGLRLVPVDPGTDFIASTALNGALSAKLGLNEVTISFGRDEGEAARIAAAYRRFGRRDVPIDQVLETQRNAVLLWAGQPTLEDAGVVHDCLK